MIGSNKSGDQTQTSDALLDQLQKGGYSDLILNAKKHASCLTKDDLHTLRTINNPPQAVCDLFRACAVIFLKCDPMRQDIYQQAIEQEQALNLRKRMFDTSFVGNIERTLDEMLKFQFLHQQDCDKTCQGYPHCSLPQLQAIAALMQSLESEKYCDDLVKKCASTRALIPALNAVLVFYSNEDLRMQLKARSRLTRRQKRQIKIDALKQEIAEGNQLVEQLKMVVQVSQTENQRESSRGDMEKILEIVAQKQTKVENLEAKMQ